MSAVEIICRNCGNESLLKREAIYEGFTKAGEKLTCAGCGHEYASEAEVPFKQMTDAPRIFTEDDRSRKIEVFDEGENRQLCRYCTNYIVNPFTQFCAFHKKEVQATDSCTCFEEKTEGDSAAPAL
jgi:ribosomal protein S27E